MPFSGGLCRSVAVLVLCLLTAGCCAFGYDRISKEQFLEFLRRPNARFNHHLHPFKGAKTIYGAFEVDGKRLDICIERSDYDAAFDAIAKDGEK